MRLATRFRSRASGLLSAGCLVGPNYSKPALPTPDSDPRRRRRAAAGPRVRRCEVVGGVPGRAAADAGAHRAGRGTTTCGMAAARVLEARGAARDHAVRPVSDRERGRAGRRRTHGRAGIDGGAHRGSRSDVEGSAAWELDFWGRFRRATESARAQLARHANGGGARC